MALKLALFLFGIVVVIVLMGLDNGAMKSIYHSMKRMVAEYQLASTLSPVPCPGKALVIVAIGQSNAGNHIEGLVDVDEGAQAYSYFYGQCFRIKDPLPGATGEMGSLWSLFAQRLSRKANRAVVVIAGGAASSSVADWNKNTAGMFSSVARRIKNAQTQGIQPNIVLWHQGEADAISKMPGDKYAKLLSRLIKKFNLVELKNKQIRPRWVIFQASVCGNDVLENLEIRAAQKAVAARVKFASLGPDTDKLGRQFRYDDCHFNALGREAIVANLLNLFDRFGNVVIPAEQVRN